MFRLVLYKGGSAGPTPATQLVEDLREGGRLLLSPGLARRFPNDIVLPFTVIARLGLRLIISVVRGLWFLTISLFGRLGVTIS